MSAPKTAASIEEAKATVSAVAISSSPVDVEMDAAHVVLAAVRFDNEKDKVPKPVHGRLMDLLGTKPEVRSAKAGGAAISFATYLPGAPRGNEGVATLTALALDYDHITGAQLHDLVDSVAEYSNVIYSSFSDREAGDDDRCVRVVLPVTRPLTVAEYPVIRAAVVAGLKITADESAKDPARIWYVPMAPAARAAGAILQYRKGRLLDPDRITPPTQVVVHGPKGQAALTKKDDVSVALLRARLKAIRDPDRRALLGLVLEGLPFAEEGARDSTLWQVLSTAAFAAPSATPDMLVDLVSASLAKMAEQHPKDHLTLEDAKDMATRALADAEAAAGRAFERGDEAEVAKMLLTELGNTTVFDEASIYTYDPKRGIWVAHGEPELSRRVQALAGTQVHAPKQPRHLRVDSKMVRGSIRLAADLAHRAGFFRAAPKGFPFQNGFVIVDSQGVRLLPHSPDHRARAALPYDYDPAAPSPKFDNFLLEVFQGDSDAEEKKALLQEFVGACLVGSATNMAKAVLLLGSGRNGKSTFIRIIKELFPEECQAAISPQDFEREYHRAELRGKLINVITELPKADLLRTEAFKAIIAGDPITARRIRHDPVRFEPRAGHLIAANTLPSVDDQSPAFFARLLLVSFNRKFVDKDDPESSKTEHSLAHKGLAEDIIRTELPGIMRWALAGAARLQARGPTAQYTVPQSHAALLESWRQSSDQVRQFLEEATTPTDIAAERTTGRDLYRAYREWANDSGHRPLAANKFGERVKALGTPHVKPHDQIQYLVKLKGLQVKQPWVSMDPVIPLNLIKLPTTGPTVSKNGPPDPPGPSSLKA